LGFEAQPLPGLLLGTHPDVPDGGTTG